MRPDSLAGSIDQNLNEGPELWRDRRMVESPWSGVPHSDLRAHNLVLGNSDTKEGNAALVEASSLASLAELASNRDSGGPTCQSHNW